MSPVLEQNTPGCLVRREADHRRDELKATERFSIVLADDFDDIRFLVRSVLEASGHFAVLGEARNGLEAVDLVSRYRPDGILLDLAMPVMSGLEALPLLRRASPSTRVIVFSGFSEAAFTGDRLDVAGFVEKGVGMAALVSSVLQVLRAPLENEPEVSKE